MAPIVDLITSGSQDLHHAALRSLLGARQAASTSSSNGGILAPSDTQKVTLGIIGIVRSFYYWAANERNANTSRSTLL